MPTQAPELEGFFGIMGLHWVEAQGDQADDSEDEPASVVKDEYPDPEAAVEEVPASSHVPPSAAAPAANSPTIPNVELNPALRRDDSAAREAAVARATFLRLLS